MSSDDDKFFMARRGDRWLCSYDGTPLFEANWDIAWADRRDARAIGGVPPLPGVLDDEPMPIRCPTCGRPYSFESLVNSGLRRVAVA